MGSRVCVCVVGGLMRAGRAFEVDSTEEWMSFGFLFFAYLFSRHLLRPLYRAVGCKGE